MSRVEENEEFLKEFVKDMGNRASTLDVTAVIRSASLSALLDISKSLAVIADAMEVNDDDT